MKNKIKNIITLSAVAIGLISCNKFLDELPDNRTSLDSSEKIKRILVSAYPTTHHALVTELSSDNVEDLGEDNPNSSRFFEEVFYWKDTKEVTNDNVKSIWETHYKAIASANEALKAIEALGNPADLDPFRGEALIARAYNHFILVNLFSNHYNTQTSHTDLGIPYMLSSETTLNPQYSRGTVKEVYEKINADIETGLPLIRDNVYSVPKYHFNRNAAYAFAARFNLFYEQWQKSIDYASVVLGANPSSVVRNWEALSLVPRSPSALGNDYIASDKTANLLILPVSSSASTVFGPYYTCARFNHTANVSSRETITATNVWGVSNSSTFWHSPMVYNTTGLDKTLFYKLPYLFEYTDLVAGIGFIKTVQVPFTTDETLLVRAEAYTMLKQYDNAIKDLNVWTRAMLRSGQEISLSEIEEFYNKLPYSTDNFTTQKKTLNPKFTIEKGTQENMLHCVLQFRRILTLHEGQRWFDIRRYGIEIPRVGQQITGSKPVKDRLTINDPRRALQIPADVISAGLTPNPR